MKYCGRRNAIVYNNGELFATLESRIPLDEILDTIDILNQGNTQDRIDELETDIADATGEITHLSDNIENLERRIHEILNFLFLNNTISETDKKELKDLCSGVFKEKKVETKNLKKSKVSSEEIL